jgi:hypothetical protein
MADGGFLEHDAKPRIFLQLLTDARLLAMDIPMNDIFRIMLAKDAYSNAKAEVVAEMNVTPMSLEELDYLWWYRVLPNKRFRPMICLWTYTSLRPVLANHPMVPSTLLAEKIWGNKIFEDFKHTILVRASVAILLEF